MEPKVKNEGEAEFIEPGNNAGARELASASQTTESYKTRHVG